MRKCLGASYARRGLRLTIRRCYSAQEFSALQSFRAASLVSTTSTAGAQAPATSLPIDISIEAIVGTLTVCIGLALGAPSLRPIQWRVWAGKIEREGDAGFLAGSGEVEKDFMGNPFALLETRPGFVDIRRQRKEFATWAKGSTVSTG